jgi:hypothetical protein
MTLKRPKSRSRFVVCIESDDPDTLTPLMIYQVLPDADAARSDYLRVIDNEGEDYLYPAKLFSPIEVPHVVERTVLRTRPATSRQAHAGRGRSSRA